MSIPRGEGVGSPSGFEMFTKEALSGFFEILDWIGLVAEEARRKAFPFIFCFWCTED